MQITVHIIEHASQVGALPFRFSLSRLCLWISITRVGMISILCLPPYQKHIGCNLSSIQQSDKVLSHQLLTAISLFTPGRQRMWLTTCMYVCVCQTDTDIGTGGERAVRDTHTRRLSQRDVLERMSLVFTSSSSE